MPSFQKYAVNQLTTYLEKKLETPVTIKGVNLDFPKMLVLEGVYFEDQKGDTLLSGEKLKVDIDLFKLLKNTVSVSEINLQGIHVNLHKSGIDGRFNFDYILEAFAGDGTEKAPDPDSKPLQFNIDELILNEINFTLRDSVSGMRVGVRVGHFDTHIKTFDLEGSMHFGFDKITLKGFEGKINQWVVGDSVFKPQADTVLTTPDDAGLLPTLDFGDLDLSAILFSYEDATGFKTDVALQNLFIGVKTIDLNNENIDLEQIVLSESDIQVALPASILPDVATPATEDTTSTMNWKVRVGKLLLEKTNLQYRDLQAPVQAKGFNPSDIGLSEVLASMDNFHFSADTIRGQLKNIQATEKSGLILNALKGNFVYTDQGVSVEDLYLETPYTILRDHIQVNYKSLNELNKDLGHLTVDANLTKSTLGLQDVVLLVPNLDTVAALKSMWNQKININARVQGRLDDLDIPTLQLNTLEGTQLDAKLHLRGLPEMDRLHVVLDLEQLQTNKTDLNALIPQGLLPSSIRLPETLHLSGQLEGGFTQFNTQMVLNSSSGDVELDGKFQISGADTIFNFQLAANELDAGYLLSQDSTLGTISLAAVLDGNGLDPKTNQMKLDAEIIGAEVLGYRYQGITLEAEGIMGKWNALVNSDDTNIDLTLEAQANLQGNYPSLQAELMLDSINLKNLNLINQEMRYHGRLVADLTTADPDYLNGTVHILQSSIAIGKDRYTLDSISLLAEATESSNLLQLKSEFLQAHLIGKYTLTALPIALQDIVNVYYQPDSVAEVFTYEDQQFDFSARFSRSNFIKNLLPDLTEMEDITLDGSFNSADKFLLVKALAPQLNYAGTLIENINLDVNTFDSTLFYSALVEKIRVSSLELNNTLLSGSVIQNQLDFGIWIKDSVDQERYHLGVQLNVEAQNFTLKLLEDGLLLNYDQWEVDPLNSLLFGTRGIQANHFELRHQDQSLEIQSEDSLLNAPLDLKFNNFRIETFTSILESEALKIGGGINGSATLSRLESNPVFVSDLLIDEFYFGKDTIGDITVQVNNTRANTFAANVFIEGRGNQVSLKGDYISIPNQEAKLDFNLTLDPLTMSTVEAFSMGYLRRTSGHVDGGLRITGTTSAPKIAGSLRFVDAKFNVSMLNADFAVNDQQILFDNAGIRFNRFELIDNKGQTARLNGQIQTNTYQDFNLNLTLQSEDFQVLNAAPSENDLYYGQLYVTTNLRITGNQNSPSINGTLRIKEPTDVTFVLPNEDPGMVDREGIVKFVNKNDTTRANVFASLDSLTTTQLAGLNLSVNLQTDPEAAFTVVIDPGSGDALRVKGSAVLTAGLDPGGNITLVGTYTVDEGSYSFTFEPVKRVFGFKKGSTITWAGDPMDGRLDITAVYYIKAPTLELVQSQIGGERANLYKQKVPFGVNLGISGEMMKPSLKFDILLDEDNAMVSQEVETKVNNALAQLRENESEMNKQVFALIILGRFMAANPFESLSGNNVESMARSSVSSLLSAQINKLAGDLIKGVELDFDLQSGSDFSMGNAQTRTDLNIGVSKMLFDDRLKVTIGSNFELEGKSRPGEQSTNIAGDISVDYQLSQDGRYLLRAYRKNQYQVTLQGQFVETGVGFIINMDYNKFKEIFMSAKRQAELYDTDSRDFRRRFDSERMSFDSVYRDSVRRVILDSLSKHDPEYQQHLQQQRQQRKQPTDSVPPPVQKDTIRQVFIPTRIEELPFTSKKTWTHGK
jgi:hypothetical protein